MGSAAVAPVISLGLLVGNLQRVGFFWKDIDWQVTLWYLPGAIAGGVLGSYLFTQIHLEGLQILLALALLLMAANYGWSSLGKGQRWDFQVHIGLAALPANWLGQMVLSQMSNERFRQLVFTFMAVSGLMMLWQQRQLLSLG